jgi:type I restriction enzyme, S subunit
MSKWTMVPLGEVLTKSEDWVPLEPKRQYNEVTIRLWGKGVMLRRQVIGAEIASSRRLRVRANQFILSRIDARNGAIGLVPESLDGAVVSADFPTFALNAARVFSPYLGWMSRTSAFVEICKKSSEGTTNRVRLQENRFLQKQISLPPLQEQRRIVARIEALAAKTEEVRRLQKEVFADLDNLCRSMIFNESFASSTKTPMRDLVRLREPDVVVRSEELYDFAGVYCFGGGVFKGQQKSGMEFAYPRLTQLKTANFVYPKLMAWEGALGIVPADCDGRVVSTEFPVFEVDESRVYPEVLDVYFRTPSVWPALAGVSTGTNVRRRRLNPSDFLNYQMPLPPLPVQQKLRQVKGRADSIKKLQAETVAELAALLPSILDKAFNGEL